MSIDYDEIPATIAQIAPDGKLTSRQKRKLYINMALRRIQPGTGSSHEFMQRRTALKQWPDLREILKEVDWVIVGGVATRAYMPERFTEDLDILVRQADTDFVLACLQKANFSVEGSLAIPGFMLTSPSGTPIDLLLGNQSWLDEAFSHPNKDKAGFPVLGFPYLILMKMDASRGRDFGDVTTMLGWANEADLDAVKHVVKKYSPQDSEDLETLIFLGQQERSDQK